MIDFMIEGESIKMPLFDVEKICRWIDLVAADHGYRVGNITYCFCDDAYILETNKKFLNHDYYTDIITFDYTHGDKISGDIVLSLDTVASNADQIGCEYDSELLRVIIHGVLHLCGIDDKGPGEREVMEAEENKALAAYAEA